MRVKEFIESVRSGWEREESTPYLEDVLHACGGKVVCRKADDEECDCVMIETPDEQVEVLVSIVTDEVHAVLMDRWDRFEELVLALRTAVLPSKIVALCAEVVALGLDKE